MSLSPRYYDVVVFGGGPAAAVLATQLARASQSVLLILPASKSARKPSGETLSPRGEFVLKQAGLAAECLKDQHCAEFGLSCWRSPKPEVINAGFDPHGRMWHVNRPVFEKALLDCAVRSGVFTLKPHLSSTPNITKSPSGWDIKVQSLECEVSVHAALLVDGTGTASALARALGSKRVIEDRLLAFFEVIEDTAAAWPFLLEPVSRGWWYSLGFSHRKGLVALIVDQTIEKPARSVLSTLWNTLLDEAPFTRRRAKFLKAKPQSAVIESGRLDQMSGEGWIALGDAAMSFDPLSSHGLCSALEQAVDLAEHLITPESDRTLLQFDARRAALFESYQKQRRDFYLSVPRFLDHEFWKNRVRKSR